MVSRFVDVVLPLPLQLRLIGGESSVSMVVGTLRRSERGLEVDWSSCGAPFEVAWAGGTLRELPAATREHLEFFVQTELGAHVFARCALTSELRRAISERLDRQLKSKLHGGGPRMARPRWVF